MLGVNGLNRVNHRYVRPQVVQGGQNFLQPNFCQHLDLRAVQPQSARAQCHLSTAFFAGHVQGVLAAALQGIQCLQQQGGLANAGVAPNQHHTALDHATAQHPVQLVVSGGRAGHVHGVNVAQRRDFSGLGQ